jgi:hypothetical protein
MALRQSWIFRRGKEIVKEKRDALFFSRRRIFALAICFVRIFSQLRVSE